MIIQKRNTEWITKEDPLFELTTLIGPKYFEEYMERKTFLYIYGDAMIDGNLNSSYSFNNREEYLAVLTALGYRNRVIVESYVPPLN